MSVRRLPSARVRLQQRAVAVRRRPLRIVAVLAAAVAVLVGGIWLVWASPVFVVDEIVVTGVEGADREAALGVVGAPFGQPLARVDTAAVARGVGSFRMVRRAGATPACPRAR